MAKNLVEESTAFKNVQAPPVKKVQKLVSASTQSAARNVRRAGTSVASNFQRISSAAKDQTTAGLAAITAFPSTLLKKFTGAKPHTKKKIVYSAVAASILVAIAVAVPLKFEFVTPAQGITTSLGSASGHQVFIEKTDTAIQNDLIVALLPGSGDAKTLIIGTVFSSNEETYALYDGEVIWQIPLADLKGKVLFATALESVN